MYTHPATQPIQPPANAVAFLGAARLWPQHLAAQALVFSGLCAITMATRIFWGWRAFQ